MNMTPNIKKAKKMLAMMALLCIVLSCFGHAAYAQSGSDTISAGRYSITSALDNSKVLEVGGYSTVNDANIQIYDNDFIDFQKFDVSKDSSGYVFKNCGSSLVMDVQNAVAASGTNVMQYQNNFGRNQSWAILNAGGGYYYIKSNLGDFYLEVAGSSTANCTNVQIASFTGNDNQKWRFTPDGASKNDTENRNRSDYYSIYCIGDSLTYGELPNTDGRRGTTYPATLESLLGNGCRVTNLGLRARSLISAGICYLNEPEYRESINAAADMYIIMLGTNDASLGEKWDAGEYERNLRKVVDAYRKANPDAAIVLIAPPTVLQDKNTGEYHMDQGLLKGSIRSIVKKVASEKNAAYIDGFAETAANPKWIGADGVHFTEKGYEAFGTFIYDQLKNVVY